MSLREEVIGGGRELAIRLEALPGKVQKNSQRTALRAGAKVILDEVKQRIPVASGDLRRSARITTRSQGTTASASVKVGNSVAWYARLVEYGTRQHYISVSDADRGRGRGIGRRGSATRRETLASMTTVNRRALQIGANFVGPAVHHPGARPRPFMRPAADAKAREAIDAYAAKLRERLTRAELAAPAGATS